MKTKTAEEILKDKLKGIHFIQPDETYALVIHAKDTEVEIVAEKQDQKVIKLIGRQRKIRGHILWEFNTKTNELNQAKFRKQDFEVSSLSPSKAALGISNKVQVNENCFYFQALNKKNAEKKLKMITK